MTEQLTVELSLECWNWKCRISNAETRTWFLLWQGKKQSSGSYCLLLMSNVIILFSVYAYLIWGIWEEYPFDIKEKSYFLYKVPFLWVEVQYLTNGHVSKTCFWKLLEWIANMFLHLNRRSIFLFNILWIIAMVWSTQQSGERHPLFWLCWVFVVACGLFIAVCRLL